MHRHLRLAAVALATGALAGTAAFASALAPPTPIDPADATAAGQAATAPATSAGGTQSPATIELDDDTAAAIEELADGGELTVAEDDDDVLDQSLLGEDMLFVGAAKVNLDPMLLADDVTTDPDGEGNYWETDPDKCNQLSENVITEIGQQPGHLMTAGSTWPENPNCIYQGGFGIGPMNGVSAFDEELGIWFRALALSDGEETLLLSIIDGEGYLWDYANKCERCGAKQIGEDVAASLTEAGYPISKDGIVLAATHTHAGPEFLGAWGFVPDWYMEDVTAAIHTTMEDAVRDMQPAIVEIGEERAREFNSERRDTYRSAEEQQMTWLRANEVRGNGNGTAVAGDTIVTLGAYAAHPTRFGTNDNVAHPDWPGLFVKAAEDRFGGIGMLIMTGLGNMSGSSETATMGERMVALMPEVGGGEQLDGNDLRLTQELWRQPVTNVPLTALGVPGFADRVFDPIPTSVAVGKSEQSPCTSAAAYSVELPATAAWIGSDFAITTGPGELFANATNTIKDEAGARIAMPLAQANDALGYMPQSFEVSRVNQQGLGFAFGGVAGVNYEDSYAIDACTGDMWLETTLDALEAIR